MTKPSYSRPINPRPKWSQRPQRSDPEFRDDCGICATVGAHRGPHQWMGVPEH